MEGIVERYSILQYNTRQCIYFQITLTNQSFILSIVLLRFQGECLRHASLQSHIDIISFQVEKTND